MSTAIESGIFQSLRAWVESVVNTAPATPYPVLQAYQNAPAPTGTYLTIDFGYTPLGHVIVNEIDAVTGSAPYRQDYQLDVTLTEVNGRGGLLRMIEASVGSQAARDLLQSQKLGLLGAGAVMRMPRLEGKDWIQESRMELRMSIGVQTTNVPGHMANAQITNQIGDST